MEDGRRKIRLCLLSIVLAAVVIGLFYYCFDSGEKAADQGGTLVKRTEYFVNEESAEDTGNGGEEIWNVC